MNIIPGLVFTKLLTYCLRSEFVKGCLITKKSEPAYRIEGNGARIKCVRSSQNGATTFSITTFSIATLRIMVLFVTLSIKDSHHKHKLSLCWVSSCWMSYFLIVMLSVVLLSVVMLNVVFSYCYAECCYAECRYAECRYAECRYAECCGTHKTSFNNLTIIIRNKKRTKKFLVTYERAN